jgi:GNAT superfamily N-acetyltransferase
MNVNYEEQISKSIKITLKDDTKVIGRAFLYLINNNLHQCPYALLEDVFIHEEFRGAGNGVKLVQLAIEKAKELGCYKLVGTSRNSRDKVHQFYGKLGFEEYGKEFRMNFI